MVFYRQDGVDVHLDEHGKPRIVERRFVVEPELSGYRLDHFLVRKIPRLSRTRAQAIIRETVSISGRPAKPNSRVTAADVVVMRREAQPEPPCPRCFDVLYRDDSVMVIDKPAGLPVHMTARFYFNTLTRVISERFPDQGWQICHRLDRETSGVLVLARGRDAARVIKDAFAKRKTRKSYLAIVHGIVSESPFVINQPLGRTLDPQARIQLRMVARNDRDALPAQTQVVRIGKPIIYRSENFSVLQCRPISGRQHQIRVHLASIGIPIVGDKLYNHGDDLFARACDEKLTDDDRKRLILSRHALQGQGISPANPGGSHLVVSAPVPAALQDFIDRGEVE